MGPQELSKNVCSMRQQWELANLKKASGDVKIRWGRVSESHQMKQGAHQANRNSDLAMLEEGSTQGRLLLPTGCTETMAAIHLDLVLKPRNSVYLCMSLALPQLLSLW